MNRIAKEKRHQSILVAVVILLMVCAVWTLWIDPETTTQAANARREADLRNRIKSGDALLAHAFDVETELKATEEKLHTAETGMMLPVGNEYLAMFTLLKDATKGSKVEFNGDLMRPVFGEIMLFPEFPYKSARFSNTVFYAAEEDFVTFLTALEKRHPYCQFQLESIRFPEVPRPDSPGIKKFSLSIVAPVSPVQVGSPDPGARPRYSRLVLKAILGSANHRLAVINDLSLEQGEEATINAGGKVVRVKCVEIKRESVVIKVDDVAQLKELRLGVDNN